jgi:hypothetical protein
MGADADVVRRLTDEVFMGGNPAVIDELVDDDSVSHDPPPRAPGTRDAVDVSDVFEKAPAAST